MDIDIKLHSSYGNPTSPVILVNVFHQCYDKVHKKHIKHNNLSPKYI